MTEVPPPPLARLGLALTGHRESNPAFAANRDGIAGALAAICDGLAACVAREVETLGAVAPVRLHSLLSDGTDQLGAELAVARGWELVAPLPFGRALNLAINALPRDAADARALLDGKAPAAADVAARAATLDRWHDAARLFELAECDVEVARLFLAMLDAPGDGAAAQACQARLSERVALAGRVMIEQSDLLIAVWDGASRSLPGGTGHTIATALAMGTPVIRIDPADPQDWRVLRAPESLVAGASGGEDRDAQLAALVASALRPGEGGALRAGADALGREAWHARSNPFWTGYRRIEALFGGEDRPLRSLVQTYERPAEIGEGSGAQLLGAVRALPGGDGELASRIESAVLRRFAWADGISTRLSDAYRGGMIANFVLSALAIASGIAYQPFASDADKWIFATVEFLLLFAILVITGIGVRRRLHRRWFETRRVAEYFRHAPILLALGVARPAGRWPRGIQTSWPEYYARAGLREPGLPRVALSGGYLRMALSDLLGRHVAQQSDYHLAKARRLTSVHHRLDHMSERLFQAAVLSVTAYLALKGAAALHLVPHGWPHAVSKLFTFLGVCFPTFGAAIAGIRYFGDFERFAAISQVTAEKLEAVGQRIALLLGAPDACLDYGAAAELAHAVDDTVVSEIENWQAVFGGKAITVPV